MEEEMEIVEQVEEELVVEVKLEGVEMVMEVMLQQQVEQMTRRGLFK